jgi:ribosomal-protein-alanine N-acetyltransferase
MAIPSITTARLLLRPWRRSDLAPFAALNADPEVMRFFPRIRSPQESAAAMKAAMAGLERRGWGLWAVERPGRCPFIGFIGLNEPAFETAFTPCVEIAWRLVRAEWGQGLCPEGARAVLDFAFGPAGLAEVVAFTTRPNRPSIRVMEKLGMTHDPAEAFRHPQIPADHPLSWCELYRIKRPVPVPGAAASRRPWPPPG